MSSRAAVLLIPLAVLMAAGCSASGTATGPAAGTTHEAAVKADQGTVEPAASPAPRATAAPSPGTGAAAPQTPSLSLVPGDIGDRPKPTDSAAKGEDEPQLTFGGGGPALTETLQRTLDMLTRERAENQRLRGEMADLQTTILEKDQKIADLQDQLAATEEQVAMLEESIENWKSDVLGFRDEMRKAEEAEIEAIQQILVLLRKFDQEKTNREATEQP